MASFRYYRPCCLEEFHSMVKEIESKKEDYKYLAGGTDLMIDLREGKIEPANLIDIKDIREMKGLSFQDDTLRIGALTTVTELNESEWAGDEFSILADAAVVFGCYEVRNRATVGGNIAHASPGAEFSSVLSVLDACVEIACPPQSPDADSDGFRRLPINEFVIGVGQTALRPGELLSAIHVKRPAEKGKWKAAYKRLSRTKGMDLASLNASVCVINPDTPDKREVRISLGAVARTPYRPVEAEKLLSNTEITIEITEKMRALIADSIAPRATSLRAGPEYKKAMSGQLVLDCLARIFDKPLKGEA
jgi:CO/xanthine dehydrogenase FAD-binding subunit